MPKLVFSCPFFRVLTDVKYSDKLHSLPKPIRWDWLMLLSLAKPLNGVLPRRLSQIALYLEMTEEHAQKVLDKLTEAKLIDWDAGVATMHNWAKYQSSTDNSTERSRNFRARKKQEAAAAQLPQPDIAPDERARYLREFLAEFPDHPDAPQNRAELVKLESSNGDVKSAMVRQLTQAQRQRALNKKRAVN